MLTPKKILLVQLYSNGDCLYATTVARQIKIDFPGCHLTWAISSFCKSIIFNNPYIDEVMEVSSVAKDDVAAFRRFKKNVCRMEAEGAFDKIFITQIAGTNQAYYDGNIRSCIFKGYPYPITVPVTPVLQLTENEMFNVQHFAKVHELQQFRNIVLFEFAPLSGQLNITKDIALAIAESTVQVPSTAVILSSGNKVLHANPAIIDGSSLTLRETAAVTHYCTLLLGCSSGITWVSTSEAAKLLPMIQILNPEAKWINPVSRDFERFNFPEKKVIELLQVDLDNIINCVKEALENFDVARNKYNQKIPLHFKTTSSIIYNLLCYLEFGAIANHIKVNRKIYGNNGSLYLAVIKGIVTFPFKLAANFFKKKFKIAVLNSAL